jgi:hypothetical protein
MINVAALGTLNQGIPSQARTILDDAGWYVSADVYDSANTRLTDLSGNGNHAANNGASVLNYSGTKYVYFTGTALEDFQTPDTAVLDITGDITLIARCSLDDITPVAASNIVSKLDSGTTGSYTLRVLTTGALNMNWVDVTGAATNISISSTATLPSVSVANDQVVWIRASLDADNGAAGNDVMFYYSTQDTNDVTAVTWTQLGTTVTTGGVATIQNSTEPLQIGARKASAPTATLTGKVYWAGIYDAETPAPGDLVCEFNPNTATINATQTTITNGSFIFTRTLAGSGKHTAIVNESKLVLGTDDYLEVTDNALLDFGTGVSFTAVVVIRSHDVSDEYQTLVKLEATPATGWLLASFGGVPIAATYEATVLSSAAGNATVDGQRIVHSFRRIAGTELSTWIDTTEGTPTLTNNNQNTTNALPMRIGTRSSGTLTYTDFEFMGAAIFRRALTDDEIAQVVKVLSL